MPGRAQRGGVRGAAGAEHGRDRVADGGGGAVTDPGTPQGPGALEGLRVVELCDELGMFAGKLLADMGAEVVKVEPPEGDRTRMYPPFVDDEPGPERSLYFWHYNTSKAGGHARHGGGGGPGAAAGADRPRRHPAAERGGGGGPGVRVAKGDERETDNGHAEPLRAGDAARGRGVDGPDDPRGGRAGLELRIRRPLAAAGAGRRKPGVPHGEPLRGDVGAGGAALPGRDGAGAAHRRQRARGPRTSRRRRGRTPGWWRSRRCSGRRGGTRG